MDKATINQQIVQMRKYVKQAKIHVINKCVKQRRFLDQKKGTEQQVAKYQRKCKKILEEIATLMKMKPDAISKVTLAKEKDWPAVLKQKDSNIADRCMAMVASYPCVQKEVDSFYLNHSDLVLKIPMLLQQWDDKGDPRKKREKDKKRSAKGNIEQPKKSSNASAQQTFHARNKDRMPSGQSLNDISRNEGGSAYAKVKIKAKKEKKNELQNVQDQDMSAQQYATDNQNEDMNNSDSEQSENSEEEPESDHINNSDSEQSENLVEAPESNSEDSHSNIASEAESELNAGASKLQSKLQSKSNVSKFTLIAQSSNKNTSKSKMRRPSPAKNEQLMNVPLKQHTRNSFKKVKMFNLEEMTELDEIPIDGSSEDEAEKDELEISDDSGKHDKDPFFLRKGESSDPKSEISKLKDVGQDNTKFFAQKDKRHFTNERFRSNKWQNRQTNGKIGGSNRKERRRNLREENVNELKLNIKDQFPAKSNFDQSSSRINQEKRFEFHKDKEHRGTDRQKFRRVNEKNSTSRSMRTFSDKRTNSTPKQQHSQNRNATKEEGKAAHLHPSWEAKKKIKEMSSAKFQGKRTVFDD